MRDDIAEVTRRSSKKWSNMRSGNTPDGNRC